MFDTLAAWPHEIKHENENKEGGGKAKMNGGKSRA
jgi:hypothetical protein